MSIAEWRYIQSIHEPKEVRNPDTFVHHFLSLMSRWRCAWMGRKTLAALRAKPFYYYLAARTKYYDEVFLQAIANKVGHIVNVGCGSDTRSYRFASELRQNGVHVLECDQLKSISDKQRIVNRCGAFGHVSYLSIDLNDESWPDFETWIRNNCTAQTLVLMEGVSPYIQADAFKRFLLLLKQRLQVGSRIAYDFKVRGVADGFGQGGRTSDPFRLALKKEEISRYHETLGYRLMHMEGSSDLVRRMLGSHVGPTRPLFVEDGLLQLQIT